MVALRLSNDMECESGERTLASSKNAVADSGSSRFSVSPVIFGFAQCWRFKSYYLFMLLEQSASMVPD